MKEIITYILGIVVCSALFVAFYRTVMHRRTSFRVARIFLLSSLVASIAIPAFDIPVWKSAPIEIPAMPLEPLPMEVPFVALPAPPIDWFAVALWTLYGVGLAVLAGMMMWQAFKIGRLRRHAEIHNVNGCEIAVSEEITSPFSFLATVFVERGTSPDEIKRIVLHESSHIRHRHSAEKITMEVLKTLLWFNPFAWWASSLLGEVHEFEADRDVLDGGFTVEEYLPLIFRQIFGYIPEISTGLGDSLTKKRFEMMKTIMKHKKYSWLRAAGVLPIAAGMLALFGFTHRAPEIILTEAPAAVETAVQAIEPVVEELMPAEVRVPAAAADVISYDTASGSVEMPSPDEPEWTVEEMPTFQGGDIVSFRNWVMQNIVYPAAAVENNIQGKVVVQFIIEKDGSVNPAVEPLDSPSQVLADEVVRVMRTSPKWSPGKNGGQPVSVSFVLPIDFILYDAPAEEPEPEPVAEQPVDLEDILGGSPLYVVDGVKMKDLDGIDPGNIESINVLKDDVSKAFYGPEARHGVVLVVTKGGDTARTVRDGETVNTGYGEVSKEANTSSITELDMKDSYAYSDLKSYMMGRVPGIRFVNGSIPVIRGINSVNSKIEPLIIIDGMQIGSFAEANATIAPHDVASISVLKDAGATSIYGMRGSNGVIVITTKRGGR